MLIRNQLKMLLFSGVFYLTVGAETCYAQGKSEETKALLNERRGLLGEVVAQMTMLYQTRAIITVQELVQAERESLKADLDWFQQSEDRIQAIERHKEAAELLVKSADGFLKIGRGPRYAVSQARAYVLEVQIELLKEKRKAKPGD